MAISKVKLPDNTVQPIKDNVTPRMYLGTCPTAAATVIKVVTVEDFPLDSNGEPLVGTFIGVKFTNTNSATAPKLNVNEIGAKSIYYNSAEATSTSSVYGGSASRYTYYVWDGTYWAWVTHGTDNNDNTLAYNVRYNSASKTTIDKFARYRILFTSADDAHWVPANTSTSTNATASRTVNQTPINPFGQIVYYGSTTSISADGTPNATVLYTQYVLTLGYSFNRTGAALTLTTKTPVYIKCAPQSNGSAIIDADTPYVQALPSTEDGKIYIYLGVASSATAVEMSIVHPVYYYKDGQIRPWTNAASQSDSLKYIDVDSITDGLDSARNGDVIGQFTVIYKSEYSPYETLVATMGGTNNDEISTCICSKTGGSWSCSGLTTYKLSDNVKFTSQTLTDAQKTQARNNIGAGTYSKPLGGIPASDIASGVIPQITTFTYDPNDEPDGADIIAAIEQGNTVYIEYDNKVYSLVYFVVYGVSYEASFGATIEPNIYGLGFTYSENDGTNWTYTYRNVPALSTNITTDKTSDFKAATPKAVYDEVHPAVQTTQPAGGFLPNVEYDLGTLTGNVTFALASAVSGITNHYFWSFMTGSTAPSITWPSGIAWNGGSAPTINAQKYYEISILNNRAVWIETDLLGGIQDDPDI